MKTNNRKTKAKRFANKETGLWVGYRPSVIDYVGKQRLADKRAVRDLCKSYIGV